MNPIPMYLFFAALAVTHPDVLEAFALAWPWLIAKRTMYN